jgi:hypothetical protein
MACGAPWRARWLPVPGLVADIVLNAARYRREEYPGGAIAAVLRPHAAVDKVGHDDGDRDVAAVVGEDLRQFQHRCDVALPGERHQNHGALRRLGGHMTQFAVELGSEPDVMN